ncbi:hypothetical protein ACFLZM_02710 [Thermodesulfobacteriota bacterium]
MRIVKNIDFETVKAYELGSSPFGRPFMSVYIYFVDNVLIDTAQGKIEKPFKILVSFLRP